MAGGQHLRQHIYVGYSSNDFEGIKVEQSEAPFYRWSKEQAQKYLKTMTTLTKGVEEVLNMSEVPDKPTAGQTCHSSQLRNMGLAWLARGLIVKWHAVARAQHLSFGRSMIAANILLAFSKRKNQASVLAVRVAQRNL